MLYLQKKLILNYNSFRQDKYNYEIKSETKMVKYIILMICYSNNI